MHKDVGASVTRVGVQVDQVLLAARRVHAAHPACAHVERQALLAGVAAVNTLHVRMLGQLARALVDADDVEGGAPPTQPRLHLFGQVAQHTRQSVSGNTDGIVADTGVRPQRQSVHDGFLRKEPTQRRLNKLHHPRWLFVLVPDAADFQPLRLCSGLLGLGLLRVRVRQQPWVRSEQNTAAADRCGTAKQPA
eukprot:7056707-Prymnesium_polylepis.1